jgi:hypothetical protein
LVTLAAYLFIVGVVMLAALLAAVGFQRLRARGMNPAQPGRPRPESGSQAQAERQASAAAEALQVIVRRRMAADPAFAGQSLDFGTAADGSLEIWLGENSFAGVDHVPDPRLRELIAQAADEFNRGAALTPPAPLP